MFHFYNLFDKKSMVWSLEFFSARIIYKCLNSLHFHNYFRYGVSDLLSRDAITFFIKILKSRKIQAFDATLRKWEEQKERSTAPSTPTHEMVSFVKRACEFVRLVETEMTRLGVSNAMLEALDAASNAISAQQEAEQVKIICIYFEL